MRSVRQQLIYARSESQTCVGLSIFCSTTEILICAKYLIIPLRLCAHFIWIDGITVDVCFQGICTRESQKCFKKYVTAIINQAFYRELPQYLKNFSLFYIVGYFMHLFSSMSSTIPICQRSRRTVCAKTTTHEYCSNKVVVEQVTPSTFNEDAAL